MAVGVICAETQEEAEFLASSVRLLQTEDSAGRPQAGGFAGGCGAGVEAAGRYADGGGRVAAVFCGDAFAGAEAAGGRWRRSWGLRN